MQSHTGCPDGMYPMDSDYGPEDYSSLTEFIDAAEAASNSLNFPISWYLYDENHEDWRKYESDEERNFKLVFLMPRKYGKTWSIRLVGDFDSDALMGWLRSWIRAQSNTWFGFTEEKK